MEAYLKKRVCVIIKDKLRARGILSSVDQNDIVLHHFSLYPIDNSLHDIPECVHYDGNDDEKDVLIIPRVNILSMVHVD